VDDDWAMPKAAVKESNSFKELWPEVESGQVDNLNDSVAFRVVSVREVAYDIFKPQ